MTTIFISHLSFRCNLLCIEDRAEMGTGESADRPASLASRVTAS
jgi:hypothetical protein